MSTNFDEMDFAPDEKIEIFLRICAGQIVRLADSGRFLEWIGKYGADLLPDLAAQIDPKVRTPTQVFRALGREIWAGTPLPHKKFAHEHLPTPGRNDPCHCGSARKFKQCCGQWNSAEMGMPPMNLLPQVLNALPKKRWAELPGSAVSLDAVANAAFHFLDDDCPEDAVKLLTPWFAGEGRWPNRLADMFDLLLDAYEKVNKRKKRKDMAKAATVRGEPQVAAIGWQRLAAMLSDEGDPQGAWIAFGHAQRADPDNISLGTLEITILLSQKKWEQAAQRARFWAARIAKMRGPEELLEWFNDVARDPQHAIQEINKEVVPGWGQLSALLAVAPPVACVYRLQPHDGSAGPLRPNRALLRARDAWDEAFPAAQPFSVQMTTWNAEAWDAADQWLPVLAAHPILWQDFEVLDDLVCAIDGLNAFGLEDVIQALTSRALALLDCVLADQHAAGQRLEWGFMENRAALRLVVRHIYDLHDMGKEAVVLPWMERMVNQINPNDNHGLRDLLMRCYLRGGDFERAMVLGDRYPDDIGPMRYNCALACFCAKRQAEADDILSDAIHEYPLIAKVLLAKNAAKPKDGPIAIGSRDEANYYRAEHLPLWPADALAWLAAVRKR